ncbi:hypothetical protein AWB80_02949 [Caballeronia pedi]|uniref:SnoaL-like domain-containing protein n=1 Tax=Caballeronia pedi TaxID=1777141 RepID=A0A158B1K0_9BURK|nr:nuclear transport factor 2 family protein [Caballeronia pedi]SAK63955.1 hypothetical protein AWB80_02949 [Caballeronia pedi]
MSESNAGAEAGKQIESMLRAWSQAAATKDARNLRRFYADDVVVFDIFPPLASQGADQYCAGWQAWFDKLHDPISFELQNAVMEVHGELATLFCINRIKIGDTCDLVRTTLFLRRIEGEWLVRHVHTSVPLPVELASIEA